MKLLADEAVVFKSIDKRDANDLPSNILRGGLLAKCSYNYIHPYVVYYFYSFMELYVTYKWIFIYMNELVKNMELSILYALLGVELVDLCREV